MEPQQQVHHLQNKENKEVKNEVNLSKYEIFLTDCNLRKRIKNMKFICKEKENMLDSNYFERSNKEKVHFILKHVICCYHSN